MFYFHAPHIGRSSLQLNWFIPSWPVLI